jgi:hypothetical protein
MILVGDKKRWVILRSHGGWRREAGGEEEREARGGKRRKVTLAGDVVELWVTKLYFLFHYLHV